MKSKAQQISTYEENCRKAFDTYIDFIGNNPYEEVGVPDLPFRKILSLPQYREALYKQFLIAPRKPCYKLYSDKNKYLTQEEQDIWNRKIISKTISRGQVESKIMEQIIEFDRLRMNNSLPEDCFVPNAYATPMINLLRNVENTFELFQKSVFDPQTDRYKEAEIRSEIIIRELSKLDNPELMNAIIRDLLHGENHAINIKDMAERIWGNKPPNIEEQQRQKTKWREIQNYFDLLLEKGMPQIESKKTLKAQQSNERMSSKLPLEIPYWRWETVDENPPEKYQKVETFSALKAQLQYFNENIRSLALCKEEVRWDWYDKHFTVYTQKPCTCGECPSFTEKDKALFEIMRVKEIKRLSNELQQRKSYGEKIAYLITQPGFNLKWLSFEGIDLDPKAPEREPEEIAAFNAILKAKFDSGAKSNWYEEQKAILSERLKKAPYPAMIIRDCKQQIVDYIGCNPEDTKGPTLTQLEARLNPQRPNLGPADSWRWNVEKLSNPIRDKEAKETFLKILGGEDPMPNLSREPLYWEYWEQQEHGQQVFLLYQWLGNWKPEVAAPEPLPASPMPTENTFCKGMPIEAAREHFGKLTNANSSNGKPFLTVEGLEKFIQRAFLGDTAVPKQLLNLNPNRETGLVRNVFYLFYSEAVKQWEPNTQCREKYIKLLTENFEGWDFASTENNFTKAPKKAL